MKDSVCVELLKLRCSIEESTICS